MLNNWLVELTDGLVKPRKDIWNGNSRKAPDTPAMEVKNEMPMATSGGTRGDTSMPAVAKYMDASRVGTFPAAFGHE
ncbi:hypothetical protein ASZ90_001295 [hydrocarbon metagenome]|uniref:Uncharacterized protein n=1 Tax=hydrocarbon metagenome TaxID=938273 RepID=A0A0W8G6U0_9ZZZZ